MHIGTATLVARDEDLNTGTIPMPTFARKFIISGGYSPQRQQISELQFDKFPTRSAFLCWKIRFKNQVTTCSDFPSEAMLWIKEVEMVDSLDELTSSRSVAGKNFQNFEMLDARSASALNKIIQNSHFKKKVSLEEEGSPERGPVSTGKTLYQSFSVQKLRESHETIQRLTSQMQEVQEQMNSMNDSGEFQEVESNHSEIVLRSQSTSSYSKLSVHAEPRQTLAT